MKTIYQFITKRKLASFLVVLFLLSVPNKVNANNIYKSEENIKAAFIQYKGKILDSSDKTPLEYANLSIEGTNVKTITNSEGTFLLKVPEDFIEKNVTISLMGYATKNILISELNKEDNIIMLTKSVIELNEISINTLKNAEQLVREVLNKKGENYSVSPKLMKAFYRETIRQRKRNLSLTEAIVNIYKTPYNSNSKDAMEFYKTRKNTDYKRLDTLALKLQGGPFNALLIDVMKYPEYIFTEESISNYIFSFNKSTKVNDKLIHVINFKQRAGLEDPLYEGELYIDPENKILTSAEFSFNTDNAKRASEIFVKQNKTKADVLATEATYRVDYQEENGKWYYSYSNLELGFKVNWKDKLFNSNYTVFCEMAVTDWEENVVNETPKIKDRIKSNVIMTDYNLGFSDPDFWGAYNIIEPDKSIELAIEKIQKQLKKSMQSVSND